MKNKLFQNPLPWLTVPLLVSLLSVTLFTAKPVEAGWTGTGPPVPVTSNVSINVSPNERCSARADTYTGNDVYWYDLDTASYLGWWTEAWGYIRATDSVGTSFTLWLTEDATQAGGSNQRTNPGSTYKFRSTWNHYYTCSICPGSCLTELRILGYP